MKQQLIEFKRNKMLYFPVKHRVNLQNSLLQDAARARSCKKQTAKLMEEKSSEQN